MEAGFETYDDVVQKIYEAALQPELWSGVVAAITEACGGCSGLLFTPMTRPADGGLAIVNNISASTMEYWAARSIDDDPYVHAATRRGLFREGHVINGIDLVSRAELIETRFYRELWEPIDLGQVCSGVVFDGTDHFKLPTVLSIFGRLRDLPFDESRLALIRRLLPHLSRALGVMLHLRASHRREVLSLSTLERMGSGVVLLNGRGRIHFVNAAARRQLENLALWQAVGDPGEGGALRLSDRLRHLDADLRRALAAALDPLCKAVPDDFSETIVMPDESARPACVLHIAALGSAEGDAGLGLAGAGGARVIVFLHDMLGAPAMQPKLLGRLFAVTPAEARAALQLLQGGCVETMAERLGVSANTLKSQLKSVYAKTRTHRQADLLKLLLALSRP
jgi:DNA-binding CsgD family transcriptional regulator